MSKKTSNTKIFLIVTLVVMLNIICMITPTAVIFIVIQFQEPPIDCVYKIKINGDDDLARNRLIIGSGTKEDPYILENKDINSGRKCCLLLGNTTKFLIIRNCKFESKATTFTIDNSANSTITFYNNKFIRSDRSSLPLASLDSTPGINITKNEFITYGEGLVVKNCSFSIFHNNYFKNEKYDYCLSFKYFSTNCIISSNTFKIMSGSCGGIFFDWISNITIENNLFLYLVHESSYSNALYCSLGENLTINNNIFQGEFQFAINLNIMKNIVLSNNIIQNSYRGIYCGGAIHGNIFGNSITNNYQYGLELGGCNFINITFNEFTQQTIFAIQITYYGNSSFIFNNNFLGNNINGSSSAFHQAYDEVGITWFNPDTRLGNYWDDLEWYEECTYEIDGNMTSDLYPLQYPVTI